MSIAELVSGPRHRYDLRLLRSELRLVFGRRRNQWGLAGLAVIPVVIAVAVWLDGSVDGADGPMFLASITENGFFVSLTALTLSMSLVLPVAVAAIAGDSIAGEANAGTLRYVLAAPVGRTRLLVIKYAAIVIFSFVATGLVAGAGLLIGLALFGGGPVILFSGSQIGLAEALLRLLGICGYLGVGLSALGAVGLFFSTCTEQPLGAAVALVMLTMISFALDAIPQLAWLHPYLLTHWWISFGELLRDPVDLGTLYSGLGAAAAYILIFCSAAWARFSDCDITS